MSTVPIVRSKPSQTVATPRQTRSTLHTALLTAGGLLVGLLAALVLADDGALLVAVGLVGLIIVAGFVRMVQAIREAARWN